VYGSDKEVGRSREGVMFCMNQSETFIDRFTILHDRSPSPGHDALVVIVLDSSVGNFATR
jgi:hypothetical protein